MTCVIREAPIYCTGCLLVFSVADAPPAEHLEGDPVEWTLLGLEGHQAECHAYRDEVVRLTLKRHAQLDATRPIGAW